MVRDACKCQALPEEGELTLRYDLRINQGETFQLEVPVLDDDDDPASLAGLVARGQIRAHARSAAVFYEWSLANSNIALDGNDVILTVPAAASSLWTFRTGSWSVELTDGAGITTRLIEGLVIVHPEVVR
jgi:hypothetical protein